MLYHPFSHPSELEIPLWALKGYNKICLCGGGACGNLGEEGLGHGARWPSLNVRQEILVFFDQCCASGAQHRAFPRWLLSKHLLSE